MKVIRESTHISGFLYEQPVSEVSALTHCGEALCSRGHTVGTHRHDGFEFHYLSRGGPFAWQIGDRLLPHRTGEITVTYPRETHRTGPDRYPETHFLWLGLQLSELGAEGKRLARRLISTPCRLVHGCGEVEPVLRGVIAQVVSRRPYRAAVIHTYLMAFVALIEQRLRTGGAETEERVPLLPYSHATLKAVAYLEKDLERRIPLSELAAAAACRSVTNFCTQFRREVGTTPAAYHRRLRLQAARIALRQPAFSITMAAHQFGFNSSQHFSTCYRREFEASPSGNRPGSSKRRGTT